ncbi:MAG: cell division protein FtsA, partial [Gemmatimonadota bacterium]
RYGASRRASVDPRELLDVSGPSLGAGRRVSRELLAHIIEQRLDEILGLVYDELDAAGLLDDLGAGVVLAGGGACLSETVELARTVFNLPVRLGEPGRDVNGSAELLRPPEMATGVGLALYGSLRRRTGGLAGTTRALGRVGEWLRDFF